MKKAFIRIAFFCTILLIIGCSKDPREKTIWDYIESETPNEEDFCHGIESLHQDLTNHGFMKAHSCYQLDCYSHHKSTYADIERVNKLVEDSE